MAAKAASCSHGKDPTDANMQTMLCKLCEFRRDNSTQPTDIMHRLKRLKDCLDKVESRVEEMETVLKGISMLIKRLTQHQANLEARLVDQEG